MVQTINQLNNQYSAMDFAFHNNNNATERASVLVW